MYKNKTLNKGLLFFFSIIFFIGFIYYKTQKKDKNISNIKYATTANNEFNWKIEKGNSVYYIRLSANDYIENINNDEYFKKLLGKYKFSDYSYIKNTNEFVNLSISEDPIENRFLISHKYSYDLNIDSLGIVNLNVYYPIEKEGGYSFNLSKDDFNMIKNILRNISVKELNNKFYIKNNKSAQSIIINNQYIINDFKPLKSNLDIYAMLMFSNYITMRYIDKKVPNNIKYSIKSSNYITTRPIPEILSH
ncbi:hypothetical protein [Chishuiella sp.]|uniref:hypothetical protein n=1 Tax=Chishuiella sp. TaxID=1969467 RepID=UPI0028A897F3|nr:hypothetical protein [Chishuiella sp.]